MRWLEGSGGPRVLARTAGLLYLLEGATSFFGQIFVIGALVVSGNAAATATNIVGNETLFRFGVAAALVAVAFHIAMSVVFYRLFNVVSRGFALLLLAFALVAIALQAASVFFQAAPLAVLGGAGLGAFSTEQQQALALVFLKLRAQAFNIFLVFFGFRCLALGYLVVRATFMPRVIGVLMALAGLGYLLLLWPPFANAVSPFDLALAAPGELSFPLWLLIFGVDARRWREQAARSGGSS